MSNNIFGPPGEWMYLNPDYRKDPPNSPHCCRCQKPLKETAHSPFTFCEVSEDGISVRLNPIGRELIGADCLKQVEKEHKLNELIHKKITENESNSPQDQRQ